MKALLETNMPELKMLGKGKVRDIYEVEDMMLIVTTDRISAFDVVLPCGVPGKGKTLTRMSRFWFEQTKDIVENHLITMDVDDMPEVCHQYRDQIEDRSMLVKKCKPYMSECVVRGYITGSGWKDYLNTGSVCGIKLPENMKESEKIEPPIFTPATKAEVGDHDENISFERMAEIVGQDVAEKLREYTIAIYEKCRDLANEKGIIIADTKLEFGELNGKIILIDEILTPDSSRFWFKDKYGVGRGQESMDKQFVRDYLETLDWDKKAPGPVLPDEVLIQTAKRYEEIADILTK